MKPHEPRLVAERDALAEKLRRLESFLESPLVVQAPPAQMPSLQRQAFYMRGYLAALNERISA
jgi:hypothetical protein